VSKEGFAKLRVKYESKEFKRSVKVSKEKREGGIK